ncbi:hypothetical protein [Lentilactobacillus kosonis]|uniref:Uncharacterized protein n=1 Tax=Lentilactobacillus kosonis TaxID=2810561 RepID=A0A401FI46_9LACO|nr:hypothetical protein [Lentilactobacillus kosonis]GAY72034.1 hypothetical protein NBRC111893_180 [Lentilactobacillus kosonis]
MKVTSKDYVLQRLVTFVFTLLLIIGGSALVGLTSRADSTGGAFTGGDSTPISNASGHNATLTVQLGNSSTSMNYDENQNRSTNATVDTNQIKEQFQSNSQKYEAKITLTNTSDQPWNNVFFHVETPALYNGYSAILGDVTADSGVTLSSVSATSVFFMANIDSKQSKSIYIPLGPASNGKNITDGLNDQWTFGVYGSATSTFMITTDTPKTPATPIFSSKSDLATGSIYLPLMITVITCIHSRLQLYNRKCQR